jgi:hypothetical protein
MASGTSTVKSPWTGALVAISAMAIVAVFAVVRGWDASSWLWAAACCAVTGLVASFTQMRRNRQLDAAARQAHKIGDGTHIEDSSR